MRLNDFLCDVVVVMENCCRCGALWCVVVVVKIGHFYCFHSFRMHLCGCVCESWG